jgi:crossover junction endodeoxyribonuclease RuvC
MASNFAYLAGCDPGLSGAVAFLFEDQPPLVYDMPIMPDAREIDTWTLAHIFTYHSPGVVVVEDLHGPAVFKLGMAYGALICTIKSLRFRLERVAPTTWQSELLPPRSTRRGTKLASIAKAQSLYPEANLIPDGCRAPKHDRADAVLIAEYGRTHYYTGA